MGIRSLKSASISTGAKRSKGWDQATIVFPNVSRSLGTFSTSGSQNPYGNWGYFQSTSGVGFSGANVSIVVGSYNSNYTTNGNCYTIANGGGGFTQRTTYPTSIFQTDMVTLGSKAFVLGGNGTAGGTGGSTAAVYYMGTGLNSWTAGTSLPSSGGAGGGYSQNNIIARASNGNNYRGTGIGSWTQIASFPAGTGNAYAIGSFTYAFSTSATYYSKDEGSTWLNANITPPFSTGAVLVGASPDNTATSIYLFYNTTTTPAGYYFNGSSYTSTNNWGTQDTSGATTALFGAGINGNQITIFMGGSGYRYATIN